MTAQVYHLRDYQKRQLERETAAIIAPIIDYTLLYTFWDDDTSPCEYVAPESDPA
jgi:hypothetical protein